MSEPTDPVPPPAAPRRRRAGRNPLPVVLASLVAGTVGGLGGGVLAYQAMDGEPAVAPRAQTPVVTGPARPGEVEPGEAEPGAPDPTTGSGPSTSDRPDAGAPEGAGDGERGVGETTTPATDASTDTSPDGTIPALSRAVLPSVALVSLGPDGRDGQGSGFVIREDGYVLTNHHVIAASTTGRDITVHLPGREPVPAEVVGSDAAYDIAVLQIGATDLVPLPFAEEDDIEVGETVVAVGAPLGLDSTVTSGIVSAVGRPVVAGEASDLSYINAIQTDAAINPGNSGGPLLDLTGHVVGVNSAIAQLPTSSFGPAGSIGLGFAIPADQARRTATQIIETGHSEHPIMGANIDLRHAGPGARVMGRGEGEAPPVLPGGPADGAGVRPGDLILEVDGTRITDYRHLLVVLRSYEVGDRVQMLLRSPDGAERTVDLVLAGSGGG